MTLFNDRDFYERDLMTELQGLVGAGGEAAERAARLERLLYWYFRRKALPKGVSPRPFLFSELRTELLGLPKDIFKEPRFESNGDFYVKAKLSDFLDGLCGVYCSLRGETGKEVGWSFSDDGELKAALSFGSSYGGFDLQGFSYRLASWTKGRSSFDAGYPFIEAVVEEARGKCHWQWEDGVWSLVISVPVYRRG